MPLIASGFPTVGQTPIRRQSSEVPVVAAVQQTARIQSSDSETARRVMAHVTRFGGAAECVAADVVNNQKRLSWAAIFSSPRRICCTSAVRFSILTLILTGLL